jgi:hypothetical protein
MALGGVPAVVVLAAESRQSSRNNPRIALTAASVFIACMVYCPYSDRSFPIMLGHVLKVIAGGGSELERAADQRVAVAVDFGEGSNLAPNALNSGMRDLKRAK